MDESCSALDAESTRAVELIISRADTDEYLPSFVPTVLPSRYYGLK